MKISTRYFSLIGILLFIAIISQTNIQNIQEIILNSEKEYLLVVCLIIPITILLKGLRWKKIIDVLELKYTLKDTCKVSMIGTFVGTLTPGQSGDLIRTLYLQDKNPSSKSLPTIIIDRLFDITALILIGIPGIIIISYYTQHHIYSIYPVILIPLILTAILTNKRLMRRIFNIFLTKFIPKQKKTYIKKYVNEFYNSLQIITRQKKQVIGLSILSSTIWILGAIQTYFIIIALGIDISFLYVIAFTPIILLTNLIPISISGIGTRDITMIFFFSLINIPSTYAISASLLLLIVLWTELSAGAILWIQNPRKIEI